MRGLCTGSGWRDGSLNLELRSIDGEKILEPVAVGGELALRISGARRCIGHRPPGAESLIPCAQSVQGISGSQCDDCFELSLMLPCLRCDGERCRNPARRPTCVLPDNHAVYLASFGPGLHKVGVARWERRHERVIEQGARAALIVARDDGQIVRRVEQQIRRAGIPDKVSPAVKISALTKRGEPGQLEEELLSAVAGLRHRIRAAWLKLPELVEIPETDPLEHRPRLISPKASLAVRGQVRTVIGQMMIIDSDASDLVAIEASSLIGYELSELASDESGSGQLALALSA